MLFLTGCNTHQVREAPTPTVPLKKLTQINQHWNNFVKYTEDGPEDHWQSPEETRLRGSGDCEDLVIVKMFDTTIAGSYRPDEIRLAYVHIANGTPHMVLVVGLGNDRMVLDNMEDEVKPLTATGYTPVYELDMQGRVYQGGIWQKEHPRFKKLDAILARYQLLEVPIAKHIEKTTHRS